QLRLTDICGINWRRPASHLTLNSTAFEIAKPQPAQHGVDVSFGWFCVRSSTRSVSAAWLGCRRRRWKTTSWSGVLKCVPVRRPRGALGKELMIRFGKGNLRIPRFEKPVYIVAGGMTDFRKRYPEKTSEELVVDALRMAVLENDLKVDMLEFKDMVNYCVYSQFADHFGDQLLAAARIHDALGFDPLGNIEVKTGGATGGHAIMAAAHAVASGYATVVPIVGWERMDEVPTKQGNAYIASAACKNFESELGWMYTAYYALMARRYMSENHVPRETLARIAVKNHGYACSSPFSQSPMKISIDDVLANGMVSDPLTFL